MLLTAKFNKLHGNFMDMRYKRKNIMDLRYKKRTILLTVRFFFRRNCLMKQLPYSAMAANTVNLLAPEFYI